ncbi:MAG: T9SS type A sorting domain-containing protein, partial [Rhodothermales bacterium]|nr:T9SS type A sorting domain-containing protein [Rhodothermales bacterium]
DVLVVDAASTGQLFTLRNLGTQAPGVSRGFDAPVAYSYTVSSAPSASTFVVGDADGDLDEDVVLGSLGSDGLVLIRNNGDGTLASPEPLEVHRRGVPEVVIGLDYEGDGDMDLLSASNVETVDLLLNDGTGSFERFVLCSDGRLGGFPQAMTTGPLDGDQSIDVGVLTFAADNTASIEVLRNLEWRPSGVAVEDASDLPVETSRLHPNYPNPFSRVTTVRFELTESSAVRLDVFDLLGRRVATVLDEMRPAGEHSARLDASTLASGIYLYRIAAGAFVETRRMVVVR